MFEWLLSPISASSSSNSSPRASSSSSETRTSPTTMYSSSQRMRHEGEVTAFRRRGKIDKSRDNWAQREARLLESGCKVMYHATSLEAAAKIESEGKLRRGCTGILGGAIYLAESKADAIHKQRTVTKEKGKTKGKVFRVKVRLGNCKDFSCADHEADFWKLLAEGYDSGRIMPQALWEYAVYNSDQTVLELPGVEFEV
ncbi:unnamed protein product [Amoebophrya sp. A25]|nr:unnamed protein product [Amoebophrya sp. A25]|eukprot:GSA25T00003659001.1